MKPVLQAGLLAAVLLWAGFAAAAQPAVPIDDPLRVDFPPGAGLSEAKVEEGVRSGANYRGWRVESEVPGGMILTTTVANKHTATVEVTYTSGGYTLRYLRSGNLLYRADAQVIHPSYNLWVRKLAESINEALRVRALVMVAPAIVPASAAAGVVVAAPAVPAAAGLPVAGSKWKYSYRDRQYDRREQFFTIEVAAVEATRVRERMVGVGGEVSEAVIDADSFVFIARRLSTSQPVVELTPYLRDLQSRPRDPPASYPTPASNVWKISAPQYSEEEVRVPAGSYQALRVEVSGTAEAFGAAVVTPTPARFVYVAWYAPELKRYVKIHHQTWSRQNARLGDEHVQLVSYQPGK